jgi:valyl-tRNA synthetase
VRDTQGRKMSKSLGNSPDLLHLIHEYGADAVRFGIMISSPAGNDLLFDEGSLEQGKHFNNKLWNALKLIKMWSARQAQDDKELAVGSEQLAVGIDTPDFAVTWFENRLNEVRSEVETLMSQFRLSEALKTIYSLIWDDFCSWFLEWIKPAYGHPIDTEIYNTAVSFFEDVLQILHPYMPFITEEIYHLLKERNDDIIVKQFSTAAPPDVAILQLGNKLKDLITAVRDARNKNNIRQKDTIKLFIETGLQESYALITNILSKQVNAESIEFTARPEAFSVTIVAGKEKLYIKTNSQVDVTVQKEKLLKDLDYLKGFLNTIDRKLSNDRFVQNAKADVIELERKKKADAEAKIRAIEQSIASLN